MSGWASIECRVAVEMVAVCKVKWRIGIDIMNDLVWFGAGSG